MHIHFRHDRRGHLYQDWLPFGVAFTYIVNHHGPGRRHPRSVYNHPSAWQSRGCGSFIHGGFVLAVSVNHLIAWRVNEQQILRDPLTAPANRSLFAVRIDRVLADPDQQVTVMFIDLDGFKEISDNYGHQTGDDVLVTNSRRLQGHVGAGDLVARPGGDEFAVLLHISQREASGSLITFRPLCASGPARRSRAVRCQLARPRRRAATVRQPRPPVRRSRPGRTRRPCAAGNRDGCIAVTVEITEGVLVKDLDVVVERLTAPKRLGADSGGRLLHRLLVPVVPAAPADRCAETDKSFVDGFARSPAQAAFARTILELGRTLAFDALATVEWRLLPQQTEPPADRRQWDRRVRLWCPATGGGSRAWTGWAVRAPAR
jgi:GGDEF domain-containing protein